MTEARPLVWHRLSTLKGWAQFEKPRVSEA